MFRTGEQYEAQYGPSDDQYYDDDDGPQMESAFRAHNGPLIYAQEGHNFEPGSDQHDVHSAFRFQDPAHFHEQSITDQIPAGISEPPQWCPVPFNGETPEQKKRRKNREAAARCQRRKKEQTEILRTDVEYLQHLVDQMKTGCVAQLPPNSSPPMASVRPVRETLPSQMSTQQSLSRLPVEEPMLPMRCMLPPMPPLLMQPQAHETEAQQQGRNASTSQITSLE